MAKTDFEDVGGGVQLVFGETEDAVRAPMLVFPDGRVVVTEAAGAFTTMEELMREVLSELKSINLQLAMMTGVKLIQD